MNIQEIRAKRHQRAETLKKNKKHDFVFKWNSPFGVVALSQKTIDRLDAIYADWRVPMPFCYYNKDVKDVFDEIDTEAGRAYRAGSWLEVY